MVDKIIEQIKADFSDSLFGRPTDIIGFSERGRELAEKLEPLVGAKEICFFDYNKKSDEKYHYLNFEDMLEKSEIMIVAEPEYMELFKNREKFNPKTKIYYL